MFAMVLGADSIDDCDVLRAGRTRRLLGGWMPAPSTLGTFLRAFTFGHVRQLDALLGETLERAWQAGAGPGDGRLVVDVDSFVGEVCGRLQAGRRLRLHQAAGVSPDPGHPRRHPRGAAHPPAQGIGEHAEGDDALLRRADRPRRARRRDRRQAAARRLAGSGTPRCSSGSSRPGWQYSIGVRMHQAASRGRRGDRRGRLADDHDYPNDGEAQIAETAYGGRRLIVRRTRLLGAQAELWPDWRHFAFLTNRTDEIALVEAEHRDHAVVEQVIADLKDQALAHFPSGDFNANGAWTVLAALAHNLLRWTQLLGLPDTHRPRRPHPAPPAARDPRPTDPPRPRLDAAPPRPLALARRLHRRAARIRALPAA